MYRKPVYYVLEDASPLLLINVHQLRHVPGRKTDVKDSEWLAQLLECGLLRGQSGPAARDPGAAQHHAVLIASARSACWRKRGDMARFPTAGPLCSWAARCPGRDDSAGKRRSGQTRDGKRYLRATLIQAALGAMRTKGSALRARSHRLRRHRGHKKAVVAVGHQILEIAYDAMRDGVSYHELGADYFERRHEERAVRRHVSHLRALGYHVTIERRPNSRAIF